jgi:3-phosphoshikimate 1-carboxyvinyltransferase
MSTASPPLDLPLARGARGQMRLPGSKSISIRALMLAALAQGETELAGVLDSDDTRVMVGALQALGIAVERTGPDRLRVRGAPAVAQQGFPVKDADLFVGNSGLSIRTLVPILAMAGGDYRVDGVPRMRERPIGDLVMALNDLGARIGYAGQGGYPPLRIQPARLQVERPIRVNGNASSQFLTGLLQAAPLLAAERAVAIEVDGELISKPYVDITLNFMRRFGVAVEREGWQRFVVPQGARYASPGTVAVEGDASSASYFLAAGALSGPVRVQGAGRDSIQGDVRFADALAQMGATVRWGEDWIEVERGAWPLKAIDGDFNHIPDAAMTLAVLALFADGASYLGNIGSWRVKETDRLAAMAAELKKLGAGVKEGPDWIRITPPAAWQPAAIDTYDDHRMAMCFSLACLGGTALRINDPQCVGKTFPDYFQRFGELLML